MLKSPYHGGHLEVIVGPMFSGKSEELIRRLNRAVIARQRVAVFKPTIDDRYHQTHVASHAGRVTPAVGRSIHAPAPRMGGGQPGGGRDEHGPGPRSAGRQG